MIRDYFADLELTYEANLDDIRRAYRRLARKFHPDLNPLDAYAHQSFHRIQEAFEHLSSTTQILKLKKQLSTQKESFGGLQERWGEHSVVPLLTEPRWKKERTTFSKKNFIRPAEDLDLEITVEGPADLPTSGYTAKVGYKFEKPCPYCRGAGGSARSVRSTCKRCAGVGFNLIARGAMHWKKTCELCIGKGFVVAGACSHCDGRGKISEFQSLEVKMSRRSDLSRPLQLRQHGHISFDGKKRGDVWVKIVQKR